MTPQQFNTGLVTRQIADGLAGLAQLGQEGVLLQNPDISGRFPCCVISPPLQRSIYHNFALDLSFTVEVWADGQLEAMELFDRVREKLTDYCMTKTNNTPLQRDVLTEKWRFGGYFETRWNAIENRYEWNH